MKKKHIEYRSRLLIGLLSLSTLSACVHTKGLGIDGTPSRQEEQVHNRDGSLENNIDQEVSIDPAFNPQTEQNDTRHSLQAANRFSWIPATFRSFARVEGGQLLWIGECVAIGYAIGYPIGQLLASTPCYATELLSSYYEPGALS